MKMILRTSSGSIVFGEKLFIPLLLSIFLISAILVRAAEYQSSSVVMNATLVNVVSINISPALSRGVLFGSITAGTNNNMAENDTTRAGNVTDYYIGNGPSTTGNLNFWHYAPDMTRGGNPDILMIGNVTHEANQTSDGVNINMTLTTDGAYPMTTTWSKIGGTPAPCDSVPPGSVCWVAYWLDAPLNLPDGTYNTTYHYCGNLTFGTTACS